MKPKTSLLAACLFSTASIATPPLALAAAPKPPVTPLNQTGASLEIRFTDSLHQLRNEIEKALPPIHDSLKSDFEKTTKATKSAAAELEKRNQALAQIQSAKALVEHARGKWIGGAEKGITAAEAALKNAKTEEARKDAQKELAKWQTNKAEGIKALRERQQNLEKLKQDEPQLRKEVQSANDALANAHAAENAASKAILSQLNPCLESDQLDPTLVKCTVLAEATPRGMATFAQQGDAQVAFLEQLLADTALMKRMLEAGGAKFGQYGTAMRILTAIRQTSKAATNPTLERLALATSLEHAKPIVETPIADQSHAPSTVDPVKRYLHYERAFLAGELDPAFRDLTAWEMRMVVGCDAPDAILAWGREMLRNYRPDHIRNPDYGWRYSSTVRTEVPYGSQNVQYDLPSLHKYQNIIMNGGVCGRRAFFGRYILQCFGIPTWGVTQKAHAALSHWTPKGWVINLGAGFERSWWDKDEVPRSGSNFLLETQARAHGAEFMKVLRSRWISRSLGEPQFNDRKQVTGGFWSNIAHYQETILAASAVKLGPLGQELAEANETKAPQKFHHAKLSDKDREVILMQDGRLSIPAVAHRKSSGPGTAIESFPSGFQLHCSGGFKTDYEFMAPVEGKYQLTVTLVTVQQGQKLMIAVNEPANPMGITVPYTMGKWQTTQPIEVSLAKGANLLYVAMGEGSRGVSIKNFTLTPTR